MIDHIIQEYIDARIVG